MREDGQLWKNSWSDEWEWGGYSRVEHVERVERQRAAADSPRWNSFTHTATPKSDIIFNVEHEETNMPYAIVEDKIAEISPQYRGELLAFIDFLLYRQNNSIPADGAVREAKPLAPRRKRIGRTLGGFEEGFYMAPDFDAPLECFKEYM